MLSVSVKEFSKSVNVRVSYDNTVFVHQISWQSVHIFTARQHSLLCRALY